VHLWQSLALEYASDLVVDEGWRIAGKSISSRSAWGAASLFAPPGRSPNPGRDLVIRIDPGQAFGTDITRPTRLCWSGWMTMTTFSLNIIGPRRRVLDGLLPGCRTGTGILAMGAALLGVPRWWPLTTTLSCAGGGRKCDHQRFGCTHPSGHGQRGSGARALRCGHGEHPGPAADRLAAALVSRLSPRDTCAERYPPGAARVGGCGF